MEYTIIRTINGHVEVMEIDGIFSMIDCADDIQLAGSFPSVKKARITFNKHNKWTPEHKIIHARDLATLLEVMF